MDFRVLGFDTPFFHTIHDMLESDDHEQNKSMSHPTRTYVQVEDDNVLIISGERKREEEKEGAKYVRMERRVGKFMRKFALPENADHTDRISAVCKDGVLTVTVEKKPPPEPKKPRTVEVKIV
ncbi:hypothetical protein ACJIZ3_001671 [Penstemon smallii]|uniref:SHSP domain-containing protein n=1 Tax=Penstemon smallii TaxID=265156 RepID=A0ABD3U6R5_9LAMI